MMNRSPRSLKPWRSRTVTGMARASSRECTALVPRVYDRAVARSPGRIEAGASSQVTGCHTRALACWRRRWERDLLVRGVRLVRWTLHSCSPVGPSSPEEVELRKYEIMLILPADADDEVIGGIT